MKTLAIVALVAAWPLCATLALAGDTATVSADVAGQKLDSGLGDMPHYRDWADKSGKNVVAAKRAAE
jgi:hypothetical protein